jgi:hypothetical protein
MELKRGSTFLCGVRFCRLRVVLVEGGDALPNDSDQILNEGEITGHSFTGLPATRLLALWLAA